MGNDAPISLQSTLKLDGRNCTGSVGPQKMSLKAANCTCEVSREWGRNEQIHGASQAHCQA